MMVVRRKNRLELMLGQQIKDISGADEVNLPIQTQEV